MNTKSMLWMFASLLVAFTLVMTSCAPAATQAPAASEEPVTPVETAITEAPSASEEPATTEEPAATEAPATSADGFDCHEDGNNMICIFGDADVIVMIPRQTSNEAFLYAVDLPTGNLEELNSDKDQFKPYRLVINFELVLDPNSPSEYITEFAPPIELGVRYTEEDVKSVGGLGNLQLGFWDEEKKYWVSFAQNSKYNFKVDGDELGGYIWVTISSWGDRHIGFG